MTRRSGFLVGRDGVEWDLRHYMQEHGVCSSRSQQREKAAEKKSKGYVRLQNSSMMSPER